MGEKGEGGRAFTRLYVAWLPLLKEAKVSGQEMLVLICLLQWQKRYPIVSRPASLIAKRTGIAEPNVRRCLSRLCSDRRILPSGEPVLSPFSAAGHGQCASYWCNLPDTTTL